MTSNMSPQTLLARKRKKNPCQRLALPGIGHVGDTRALKGLRFEGSGFRAWKGLRGCTYRVPPNRGITFGTAV